MTVFGFVPVQDKKDGIQITKYQFYWYRGGIKKIDGINMGKNLKKGDKKKISGKKL